MLANLSAIRLSIIAGGILFFVIVTLGIIRLTSPPASHSHRNTSAVTLIYVGADDCAPCKAWQRNQGAAFLSSAEFHHLTYREVKSPSLSNVLQDENWPEDLRAYRRNIDRRAGVPLWLVVADNELVMQNSGLSQWNNAVLPKIKILLR